VHVMNYFASKV